MNWTNAAAIENHENDFPVTNVVHEINNENSEIWVDGELDSFPEFSGRRMKKKIDRISPVAMYALRHYHWPGNIRELQNVIERAVIVTNGAELQVPLSELMRLPYFASGRYTSGPNPSTNTKESPIPSSDCPGGMLLL